jgi:hypothetical protein
MSNRREGGCWHPNGCLGQPFIPVYRPSRAPYFASTPLTWRGPPPRFHESLWGVLQKLSHLNALDLQDQRELLGVQGGRGGSLEQLRWSIALESDPLRAWSLQTMEPIVTAPGEASKLEVLRFCEDCLEHGFHSVIFQMPELARCPAHDTKLQDHCSKCGATVDYCVWRSGESPGSFECRCGRLLWRHRNSVAQWYRPPRHIARLDAFVHRLLALQRLSKAVWFRIDRPAIGVSCSSGIAERLGAISPTELLKLPRVYRRFFCEEAFTACVGQDELELSAGVETCPIAATDLFSELIHQVECDVTKALSSHRPCIAEITWLTERDGPVLSVNRCALANALVLWRAHWSVTALRWEMCRLLEWQTLMTVSALQERRLISSGSYDSAMARGSPASARPWVTLRGVLGRQVLITSFVNITTFVSKVIGHSKLSSGHTTHRSASPDRNPLDAELPPIWAVIESGQRHILRIRHGGTERLRILNEGSCRASCAPNSGLALQGSSDQQLPKPRSLRGALDLGLSFAQLGIGRRCY